MTLKNTITALTAILLICIVACVPSQETSMQGTPPTVVKQLNISDFLTKIPDTLLLDYSNEAINDKWLSSQESKILLRKKAQQITRGYNKIEITQYEPENNLLVVSYGNDEEGVAFHLQFWERKKGKYYLGINKSFDDHCCNHSSFYFYEIKGKNLIDVTKEKVPVIDFTDFLSKDFVPIDDEHNILTQSKYMWIGDYFPSMKVLLNYDIIDLSCTKDELNNIEQHVIPDTLYLNWEGDYFKKILK